ncbi:hypothetical protein KR093_006034, partial [Drosophila rubida]
PMSSKFSLWTALCAPIKSALPIRTSTGNWARSEEEKEPTDLLNIFKMYFSPIQHQTGSHCQQHQMSTHLRQINQLYLRHMSYLIINEQLNPKKSPGCDLISAKMIIKLPFCAVRAICQLFNAITRHGHFPERWKKSIIIMIPKP